MMRILTLFFFWAICFSAFAQKLPNVQQVSLRAPANVKVDGKATEWGEKLQAYNPATEVYYSMANDDKKLYLALQVKDHDVINRVIAGGITVTIKEIYPQQNKTLSLTYPFVNIELYASSLPRMSNYEPDISESVVDSIMRVNNKKLEAICKFIKVSGITNLDTVSVYNELGIEAAGKFDLKKIYTVELSVPLTFAIKDAGKKVTLAYQIRINGINTETPQSAGQPTNVANESLSAALSTIFAPVTSATDFWGEYTLAK
jgi:hypothetical protein